MCVCYCDLVAASDAFSYISRLNAKMGIDVAYIVMFTD
jgi:hypothetical protein